MTLNPAQVVDPKPGFNKVVNNFSGKDYQTIGLSTVLSMPFGYFAGMHALSVFISRFARVPQPHRPHTYAPCDLGTTAWRAPHRRWR